MVNKKAKRISVTQLKKLSLTDLPSVILVLGQEQALLDQAKTYFEHLLIPEEQEMNYGRYDLTEDSLGAALDDAASIPFFGDWRIVMLTQPTFLSGEARKNKVDHEFDALIDYLTHPQPSTKLIFWANYEKLDERKKVTKAVENNALIVDASKLQGYQLTSALKQLCQEEKIQIETSALELLQHRVDEQYSLAAKQLQQLALFVGSGRTITVADVDQVVDQVIDDDVFSLVANTLNRQQKSALEIYQQLLINGNEPIQLLSLITSQIRLLLQTKILRQAGFSQGDIAGQLKVHPYRVKLALQQERQFGLQQLKRMSLELVDLDYQIKSGRANKEQALQLLIIKFSSRAEQATFTG
ncbi:DNA polymerase III subunit delta [Lapidilactobacillus bayanensis]|uniref:DNA polymerase III subunit delta n=1 Tax=Lapidilactobacillus bayanensis TaxID=2485998 RepID=UPI0013DE11C2|nr:DNA polymerase III subunit delta [Lapidilactobacillus bayanensis]